MIASRDSTHSVVSRMQFEQIYRRNFDFVCRFLRGMGVHSSDVKAESQQVFVTAYRSLPSFDGRSSIRNWLGALALRAASDYRRRRSATPEELFDIGDQVHDIETSQFRHKSQREQMESLVAILTELPFEQRATLVLFELEGMSSEDIAELMHVPTGTVRSRLTLARATISRRLSEQNPDPSPTAA